MEIKVLGPLEVREGQVSVVPTAGKPRQILALLALNAGQVVLISTLMEELWGPKPPRSASSVLQTYILQLRGLVKAGLPQGSCRTAKDILQTRPNGYVLNAPPHRCDVREYERLADAGRSALAAGDDETASRVLRDALALWRGPALVDVKVGSRLSIEVMRLQESRIGLLEQRIETDLRLGRHHEVLSELAGLCAQHPWHESLHAQHMVALYRSGRQGQALDVYQRLHAALVEEFGLEPSSCLQQVQRGILRSDPDLDLATRRGLPQPVAV